jgi:hypothetical protein
MIQQFWDYAETNVTDRADLLECNDRNPKRPPIFRKNCVSNSILISPEADEESRKAIVLTLAANERHRYFGSMRSSQALAQSVFGNLEVEEKLGLLEGLAADEQLPAFGDNSQQASL